MILGHLKLSAWYHQLAQQLEAGLSLAEALQLSGATGAQARGIDEMVSTINAGGSVDQVLATAAEWLPIADRLLLSAAAAAGRMPRTLHVLSLRHAQLRAAKIRVVIACLYPVAVLHLGVLLFPVLRMIDWEKGFLWDAGAYVREVGVTLLLLWSVLVAGWAISQQQNAMVARLLRMIPIIGRYLRTRSLADFSFGLGNFLEAGVPIGQAWITAGLISRSPEIQAAADEMASVIARGEPPGRRLSECPCFPPEFVALYRTGEATGQLEQNLQHLTVQNEAAAQRALTLATVVYPSLLFMVVAAGVGYFVISIYGGYLKMLTDMAGQ